VLHSALAHALTYKKKKKKERGGQGLLGKTETYQECNKELTGSKQNKG
jgi:hypothetical protein